MKQPENTALDLSLQAITLIRDTNNLRQQLENAQQRERIIMKQKDEQESIITELCETIRLEKLEHTKTKKVLYDTDLKNASIESTLNLTRRDLSFAKEKFQQERYELIDEKNKLDILLASTRLETESLRNQLVQKENQLLNFKSQNIHMKTTNQRLDNTIKQVRNENSKLHIDLKRMIDNMTRKETILNKLEQKLKENEIERKNNYMEEMSKSRKEAIGSKLRDEDYRNALIKSKERIEFLEKKLLQVENRLKAFSGFFVDNSFNIDNEVVDLLPRTRTETEFMNGNNLEESVNKILSRSQYQKFRSVVRLVDDKLEYKQKLFPLSCGSSGVLIKVSESPIQWIPLETFLNDK